VDERKFQFLFTLAIVKEPFCSRNRERRRIRKIVGIRRRGDYISFQFLVLKCHMKQIFNVISSSELSYIHTFIFYAI
jgi:hypothetical protein